MVRAMVVVLVAVLGSAATAPAQIATAAIPVSHGALRLARGAGRFDPQSGAADLTIRRWRLKLADGSNGVYPGQEPIVIAIGTDQFRLEAGALAVDRRGRRFRRRARRSQVSRGIVAIDIRRRTPVEYEVSFTLTGVNLFELTQSAPVCMPMALIIGDDDGFSGVDFDRARLVARAPARLTVSREPCTAPTWPWT